MLLSAYVHAMAWRLSMDHGSAGSVTSKCTFNIKNRGGGGAARGRERECPILPVF